MAQGTPTTVATVNVVPETPPVALDITSQTSDTFAPYDVVHGNDGIDAATPLRKLLDQYNKQNKRYVHSLFH